MALANVALTDTFDTWRTRTNQVIVQLEQANGSIANAAAAFNKANSANVLAYNTGIGANAWSNTVATAGNNYTVSVGASANAWSNTVATAGNNYTVSVGASANAWSNTKLSNTNGMSFAGSLYVPGNLGIGTSSPTGKLSVNGYMNDLSIQGVGEGVEFKRGDGNAYDIFLGTPTSGTGSTLGLVFRSNYFIWKNVNNTVEYARIDASGNLGLGVTPSAWGIYTRALQMGDYAALNSDTASGSANFSMNAYYNGTNWIYRNSSWPASYYSQINGQHRWYNAPSGSAGGTISFTQAMTLDASGRLGVGVASPGCKLDVQDTTGVVNIQSTTGSNAVYTRLQNTGGVTYFGRDDSTGSTFGFSAYASMIYCGGNYPFAIAVNGTERARIDASGNLGIGTTTPSYKLDVNGPARIIGNLISGPSSLTSGGWGVTSYNLGTGSGTVTPSPYNGNYQYITNNGAFTLAVPSVDCAIDILVTNGASAGTITISGYTAPSGGGGDIYATTNANKYLLMIRRIGGTSTYAWKALQ